MTAFGDDEGENAAGGPTQQAGTVNCTWNTEGAKGNPQVKDVGMPQPTVPNVGTRVMAINTGLGPIEVQLDLSKVPCTAASFAYLASKKFFDGSKCHRILPGLLQCGDPNARGKGYRQTDGMGGPSYRFGDENLPKNQRPPYPAGVVAMANSGPDTNGSQFFMVYEDTELQPAYTVLGKVTKGLDLLKQIGAAGHDGAFDPQPGGGHPKKDVVINSLTVSGA